METLIYRYFEGCYSSCSLLHRIAVPPSADSAVWNTSWKIAFFVFYCWNTQAMSTWSLGVKRGILSTASMLFFVPLISSDDCRSTTICNVGHFELLLQGRHTRAMQAHCNHIVYHLFLCEQVCRHKYINLSAQRLVLSNVSNAELSPKRSWRGPRPQELELREEGTLH